ncbi:MAG: hypothetical protein ACE5JA_00595 [bacterium]
MVGDLVPPGGESGEELSGSELSMQWDGCDRRGNRLPAGTYFIKGTFASLSATHKLVILR